MTFADYRPIGDCFKMIVKDHLSELHASEFLIIHLRNGTLHARGVNPGFKTGWQFERGGKKKVIPPSFWHYVDIRSGMSHISWKTGSFEATYRMGEAIEIDGQRLYFLREVEVDWPFIERLIEDEDLVPPYFVDMPYHPDPDAWYDDSFVGFRGGLSYPMDHVTEQRVEGGPGRKRGNDWNQWVAELAWRASRGEIKDTTTVSMLIRSLENAHAKRGIACPPANTVREAATAVIKRLFPDDENDASSFR